MLCVADYQVCFMLLPLLHSHLINNCTSGRFTAHNRRNGSVTIFLLCGQAKRVAPAFEMDTNAVAVRKGKEGKCPPSLPILNQGGNDWDKN